MFKDHKQIAPAISNHEWRHSKHKMRVHKGQVWRKRDSGNIGVVMSVSSDHVVMRQPQKKRTHHVTKKDLFFFWEQV